MGHRKGLSVLAIVVCGLVLLPLCSASAEPSYLKAKDEIAMVGDSVLCSGVNMEHMQQVIDTVYPGSGIKLVDRGSGGQSAGTGAPALQGYAKNGEGVIATVMFGVNDTSWSAAGAEAKAKTFVEHMSRIVDVARAKGIEVIFTRETLTGRWACVPLYMAFTGDAGFASDHTLFCFSRVYNTSEKPHVITAKDFVDGYARPREGCKVARVEATCSTDAITFEFQWPDDTSPALADKNPPFTRKGQPCDALEFIVDLRPHESTGRYTTGKDETPKGMYRLGVFKTHVSILQGARRWHCRDGPVARLARLL